MNIFVMEALIAKKFPEHAVSSDRPYIIVTPRLRFRMTSLEKCLAMAADERRLGRTTMVIRLDSSEVIKTIADEFDNDPATGHGSAGGGSTSVRLALDDLRNEVLDELDSFSRMPAIADTRMISELLKDGVPLTDGMGRPVKSAVEGAKVSR